MPRIRDDEAVEPIPGDVDAVLATEFDAGEPELPPDLAVGLALGDDPPAALDEADEVAGTRPAPLEPPEFPPLPETPTRVLPPDDVPSGPARTTRIGAGTGVSGAGAIARVVPPARAATTAHAAEAARAAGARHGREQEPADEPRPESHRADERRSGDGRRGARTAAVSRADRRHKPSRRGLGVAVTGGCAGVVVCAFLLMGNNSGGPGGSGGSGSNSPKSTHSATQAAGGGVVNIPQASAASALTPSSASPSASPSPSPSRSPSATATASPSATPSATRTHKKGTPSPSPSASHFCFLIC